jgi:outer membrane protein TolC
VACLVLLLGVASPVSSGEGASLLDAHLAQADAMRAVPAAGTDDALRTLKADIEAKAKTWSERAATKPAGALLDGIPPKMIETARAAAPDGGKTRALLSGGVTLDVLLVLSSERNPEVRAAFENWRASVRRFEQASYLEELIVQYRAFVRELDTKVGPQTHKEMPGKTFAFPSTLALKGQIADAETQIAWLKYHAALRQMLNETARQFFEVQYTGRALTIVREMKTLFSQMAENAKARLEAGAVSQADALKAQSELAIVENRLAILERERTNLIARVNTMLALPADSGWGVIAESALAAEMPALADALTQARAANQELLAARQDLELMQLMVRMAETELHPRASAGYSQLAPSVGADAGPTRSMMAAFPEKLEVNAERAAFGVNAAFLDELRVRIGQAAEMAALAESKTEFAVKDALFRLDAAARTEKTYGEQVVPRTKQAFETLKGRYASGAAPFIEFLDSGRSYLQDALMLEEARRDRGKAAVDLQDALGAGAAGSRQGKGHRQ